MHGPHQVAGMQAARTAPARSLPEGCTHAACVRGYRSLRPAELKAAQGRRTHARSRTHTCTRQCVTITRLALTREHTHTHALSCAQQGGAVPTAQERVAVRVKCRGVACVART